MLKKHDILLIVSLIFIVVGAKNENQWQPLFACILLIVWMIIDSRKE